MFTLILTNLLLFSFHLKAQRPSEDLIQNLPGLDFNTTYDQYAGYLDLNNGHHLFYWLTESQNDPDNDPVVLWLNGGPGCSSLYGLFYELGPFHVNDNGSLYDTAVYSWNDNANILFLETPICVGFSYQDDIQNNCSMNDNSTADDNYYAILTFLDKFPVYKSNDFYITGESYAGYYIPTLTLRILQGNEDEDDDENMKINLKAFAICNGAPDWNLLDNSLLWFYYHHGMISSLLWNELQENCCTIPYNKDNCHFYHPPNPKCAYFVQEANNCCNRLNIDNIYGDYIENDSKGMEIYLNQRNVQTAIHVYNSSQKQWQWSSCSNTLKYETIYNDGLYGVYNDIFTMDTTIYMTMFVGDIDPYSLGAQWFINNLNHTLLNKWREWFVNNENAIQNGGWTKDFERIHFVTVRGAGHMAPQFRPQASKKVFEYFLQNNDLH